MRLQRITCEHFRRLTKVEFCPEAGINVIRGGNAQGKTTVLEAIQFAATSKSHRTNHETELVQHGQRGFILDALAQRVDREVRLESRWWEGAKRIRVNGVALGRVSAVLGKLHVILFCPEDTFLVKGGAAYRRRFLDLALSQADPVYLANLQRFRQVLRQRNEVLRARHPDAAQLEVWEAQFVPPAAAIMESRAAFLSQLARGAAAVYARIGRGESLDLVYRPDVALSEPLAEVLRKARDNDIKRRVTMRGPHRDDFLLQVDGQPARQYASQGQQKSAAFAVKLAELEWVHERVGEYPVLLLDEVFSELDAVRARQVVEAIPRDVQCILTSTRDVSAEGQDRRWPCFQIEQGNLERV